ncbi:MAG: HD domain-containing phosphohydrolase [Gemmatimonadota bacterium]
MNSPVNQAPALTARCLLVDDDAQVRSALTLAIQTQGLAVRAVGSAREALAALESDGEYPICITDVNMPEMDGVDLLHEVTARYPDMAVIMLTDLAEVGTAIRCLRLGALDYITKPVLIDEVNARLVKALDKRELVLQNRQYQHTLESRVRELDGRNRQSLINGVEMLVFALEAKDAYTSGHSLRVKEFAMKTAVRLGFTGERLAQVELGSKLHDIGKIGTREAVLNKPGRLDPDEFEHIKLHTVLGERILQPFLAERPTVLSIVRSHHERVDGSGFPDKMTGDRIPIEARIVAVADAYDAMTTNRAYRPSRAPADAVQELRACAGTHFDAEIVEAFLKAHSDITVLPVHS